MGPLDNKTLIIINILLSFIITIGAFIGPRKEDRQRLFHYQLANLFYFIGFLALATEGYLPHFISIILANTFILVSTFFIVNTSLNLYHIGFPRSLLYGLITINLSSFIYFTYLDFNTAARIMTLGSLIGLLLIAAAVYMLACRCSGFGQKLLIAIFFLFGGINIYRSLITFYQAGDISSMFHDNVQISIALIAPIIFLLSWNSIIVIYDFETFKKELKAKIDLLHRISNDITRLHSLHSINNSTTDVSPMTSMMFSLIQERFGIDSMALFLIDTDSSRLKLKEHTGLPDRLVTPLSELKINDRIRENVTNINDRIYLRVIDYPDSDIKNALLELTIDCLVTFPLQTRYKNLGVLILGLKKDHFIHDEEFEIIEIILRHFSTVLNNYQFNKELIDAQNKYRTIFNLARDALFVHDMEGNFIDVNEVACQRLEYPRKELIGHSIGLIDKPYQTENMKEIIRGIINKGSASFETIHISKTGKEIPVWINSNLIEYNSQKVIMCVARDISERKKMEAELEKLAVTDALTGAYNRRFFLERFESEFMRNRRYGGPLTIAIIDIDDFKSINDRWGHDAGDETLKTLVNTTYNTIRKTDIFSRYGGEEFAILFIGTEMAEAQSVTERLRSNLDNTHTPYNGASIHITISVGMSIVHENDEHIDESIKRADEALYRAKSLGKNRVVTFQ